MVAGFAALDQLTLAEIEMLFGERPSFARPVNFLSLRVRRQGDGREYNDIPGAVFYELEDLVG